MIRLHPSDTGRALRLLALLSTAGLAACAAAPEDTVSRAAPAQAQPEQLVPPEVQARYGAVQDGDETIPAVPAKYLQGINHRQEVDYWTDEKPGTIIVDPYSRFLYLVEEGNRALRYRVAVGAAGRGFSGEGEVPFKKQWPSWTPTKDMIEREPETYGPLADGMDGGIDNPLGARALYLFKNGKDTLYRIHGTPQPWTVGKAVSSGCIRLFNQDILDLYDRVGGGTKVVVLSEAESGKGTVPPEMAGATPYQSLVTGDQF